MAALTAIQALSILTNEDLANLYLESSFYQLCASGLLGDSASQIRLIAGARSLKDTPGDDPLMVILAQFFDGDPLNQQTQTALAELCLGLNLIAPDSGAALLAAISG